MKPDWDAWGDPLLNEDVIDEEPSIDWQARGRFACGMCGKVMVTANGLKSHAINVHGPEYGNTIKREIIKSQRKIEAEQKAARQAEAARLATRKNRKVILSTDEVDQIVAEIESLIDMMEPYWSQGGADKSARALVDRLNAMADGREIEATA